MKAYAQFFARHTRWVLAFVVLATAASVVGVGRLEFDDVPRQLFASEDREFARLLQLYEDFGSDDNDAILVLEAEDWFDPAGADHLIGLARAAAEVPGVRSVVWFGAVPVFGEGLLPRPILGPGERDLARARELAFSHPLTRGRLISPDGRVVVMVVRLEDKLLGIEEIEPSISALRGLTSRLDEEYGPARRARVTGVPTIRVEIYRTTQMEQKRFLLTSGVLCALLALVLFRSLGAVLCSTIPPLVAALWAFGAIGLSGARLDILGGVLSMLVIVIALTDSVHLMIDVRLSRAAGLGRMEAAAAAIRHLGIPCALTSLTTAVGFGSLALATVPAIRRFGVLAAVSVLVAFLAVITLMPLLASVMPEVGEARAARKSRGSAIWERRAGGLVTFLIKRCRTVSVLGVLVTVGLSGLSMQLVAENRLTEALPHGEAYGALMRCEEAFGGVLPCYVVAEWEESLGLGSPEVMQGIEAVSEMLAGIEELGRPFSVLDLLDSVPAGRERPDAALAWMPDEVVGRVLRRDLGKALVHAPVPDGGSEAMGVLFARMQAGLDALASEHPSLTFYITGTDIVARTNVNRMIDDLARSLAFAVFVIFGVIALEFRSLRIGVISLLPNLFPLVLVGGVLRLLGLPLQMVSAVLFTVLLGLAVDDTIHFLARFRREQALADEGTSIEHQIHSAYLAVGRAILMTTAILILGFLTVSLSAVPTNRVFAVLSCVGLLGALFGDLVFLPALLALRRRRAR